METKQHHANKWIINCIRYAGMYVGAIIGAGYASGQETLQFFVSYGYIGIVGTIIAVVLFAWYGTMFMELGQFAQRSLYLFVRAEGRSSI